MVAGHETGVQQGLPCLAGVLGLGGVRQRRIVHPVERRRSPGAGGQHARQPLLDGLPQAQRPGAVVEGRLGWTARRGGQGQQHVQPQQPDHRGGFLGVVQLALQRLAPERLQRRGQVHAQPLGQCPAGAGRAARGPGVPVATAQPGPVEVAMAGGALELELGQPRALQAGLGGGEHLPGQVVHGLRFGDHGGQHIEEVAQGVQAGDAGHLRVEGQAQGPGRIQCSPRQACGAGQHQQHRGIQSGKCGQADSLRHVIVGIKRHDRLGETRASRVGAGVGSPHRSGATVQSQRDRGRAGTRLEERQGARALWVA